MIIAHEQPDVKSKEALRWMILNSLRTHSRARSADAL